jgi:hypothetical protein
MRWFHDRGGRHATEPHQGEHNAKGAGCRREGSQTPPERPGPRVPKPPRPKGGPRAPYQMEAASINPKLKAPQQRTS